VSDEQVPDDHPRLPPVDPAGATVPASSLSPELLAGLLADGDDELASWTLRHALVESPREAVYDGLLAQAMELVGERWATGRWSVAEEHLASQTLLRALERVRPDLGPEGRIGPLAVLAGVAGEHHMIGLVCLDHVLCERGWTVADLGADVPTPDLAGYVARTAPALVALTASDVAREPAVVEAVAAIRGAHRGPGPLPVMLGGRLAGGSAPSALDLDWMGASLVDAAAFADRVLASLPADRA
jgi:methanogenic corrinoid protein MtbC1